jgi:hypothetical protein
MGNAGAESVRSERLTDVEIGFEDARLSAKSKEAARASSSASTAPKTARN